MSNLNEKATTVRILLAKYCLTNKWLVYELKKIEFDISGAELTDVYNGRRKGPKAVRAIELSLKILCVYENLYIKNSIDELLREDDK